MTYSTLPIAVLGAGSWGTALAILLANKQIDVNLWGHDKSHMQQLAEHRENRLYLPRIALPKHISIHLELAQALKNVNDILIVVPSHAFRQVLTAIKPYLHQNSRLLYATKGLEVPSAKFMHEIIAEVLGDNFPQALLSGPSFAKEVASGLPTALTIASPHTEFAEQIAEQLHNHYFRAYTNTDLIGTEIGGTVKNSLAIAAGISDGLGFGANSLSALITRGLAEMMRFGQVLGAKSETLMGLAGMGDLVLTCTDNLSRNRRFGLLLAQGKTVAQAKQAIGQEVEGYATTAMVYKLAQAHQIEMPIVEQSYQVLYQNLSPITAVDHLLSRAQKAEN